MSLARHPQVIRLRQQLDAAPWLRWALLGIGLLLALFALQALEATRTQWQKDSIEEETKLRRIKALQGQDVWLARARQASELHRGLLAQLPQVNTQGAAQAAVQAWLQSMANATPDPQRVRIAVDGASPVEAMPGVLRIRGSLQGSLSPRQALNVARSIESAENLVVIDAFDLRSDPNGSATIRMSAYYRVAAAPAAEAAP